MPYRVFMGFVFSDCSMPRHKKGQKTATCGSEFLMVPLDPEKFSQGGNGYQCKLLTSPDCFKVKAIRQYGILKSITRCS
jgi:hypothetical protein